MGVPVMAVPARASASMWSRFSDRSADSGFIESVTRRSFTVVHERLGAVERLLHVLGNGVAQLGDLTRDPDEPAEQRVLLDDPGVAPALVVAGVGREDLRQDRGPTDGLEQARAPKLVGNGDGVGGLAGRVERVDRVEDVAVGGLVEVGRVDRAGGLTDGRGRQHHRPEQGLLRVEVMRWDPARPAESGRFGDLEASGHGSLTILHVVCGLPEANPVIAWGYQAVQLWTAEVRLAILTAGCDNERDPRGCSPWTPQRPTGRSESGCSSWPSADPATPMPTCPGWTVKELFAHVSGVAADVLAGNIAEAGTEPWVAAQLDEPRGPQLRRRARPNGAAPDRRSTSSASRSAMGSRS